jgi:hypothetical protein
LILDRTLSYLNNTHSRQDAKLKPQIQPEYQKIMVLLRAAPLNNVLSLREKSNLSAVAAYGAP